MKKKKPAGREHASLEEHFDWAADNDRRARRVQRGFHRQLLAVHRHHIPEGSCVLEWGCGSGDLLRGLNPSRGLGIDLSKKMIERAELKNCSGNAGIVFRVGDLHKDKIDERFDYIVLNYLTGYLRDVQGCLKNLRSSAHARTRLHVTSLNTPWLLPLSLAQRFGAVMKQPSSNWLSKEDHVNLLELAGWELVSWKVEQLFPFQVPLLNGFFNRFLARLPIIRHLGITVHIIARPRARPPGADSGLSCSVIVPTRNEAGNIAEAFQRIPVLGRETEVIFVEGGSSDNTWEVLSEEIKRYQGPLKVRAVRQSERGKWNAVKEGFESASGDVLVIQDGDLTAPPEDLPKFFEAIQSGVAEFANGSRLVYPLESQAMRFLNILGNHFFAKSLSFVLGQPIKDSLCGTKMLLRDDYLRAMKRIAVLGDFDPFGDFNLLFGAALCDLRIRDIPVRYRDRSYGETNISRFSHGWLLLRMTIMGFRYIRFFPLPIRGRLKKKCEI
jgi:2-polyprenyl-3-methyl-5-hydroxy-6-metoxy-1,4-benzoquinol methylase